MDGGGRLLDGIGRFMDGTRKVETEESIIEDVDMAWLGAGRM
jgi:hypothetical protein